MESCGQVRDIEVQQKLSNKGTLIKARLRKKQRQKIRDLTRNICAEWPLLRRSQLLFKVRRLNTAFQKEPPCTRKELLALVYKSVEKLKDWHPRGEQEWHSLRRRVRRINYLNELIPRTSPSLVSFQKKMGDWHDLYLMNKRSRLKKIQRRKIKRLKRENKKALHRIQKMGGEGF
jgi:hypothetical protein